MTRWLVRWALARGVWWYVRRDRRSYRPMTIETMQRILRDVWRMPWPPGTDPEWDSHELHLAAYRAWQGPGRVARIPLQRVSEKRPIGGGISRADWW